MGGVVQVLLLLCQPRVVTVAATDVNKYFKMSHWQGTFARPPPAPLMSYTS